MRKYGVLLNDTEALYQVDLWTHSCDQKATSDHKTIVNKNGHQAISCRFVHFKLRILLEPVCLT